jgi:hypothetical protein
VENHEESSEGLQAADDVSDENQNSPVKLSPANARVGYPTEHDRHARR